MKDKYIVKETNGWWYEGQFYNCDTVAELTKAEYEGVKDQVRLEPVKDKVVKNA